MTTKLMSTTAYPTANNTNFSVMNQGVNNASGASFGYQVYPMEYAKIASMI